MNIIASCIIVLAFCAGTVGAAGLDPNRETPEAWVFLGVGLLGIVMGRGLLSLRNRRGKAEEHQHSRKEVFMDQVLHIRDLVAVIDREKEGLPGEEFCQRIDSLLRNEYFDLTSRHEEFQELVGFKSYVKVWEGLATAERLLARAWSMATDSHLVEAREEIPRARAHLDQAASAEI